MFQKNGTYRGSLSINQSGNASNPILISSYGEGTNPIFLGSRKYTNWVTHQGNIWKTTTPSQVLYIFQEDELLPLARYPNNTWLRNDNGNSTTINDSELSQPSSYWNGARLVVRSSAWSYHIANISNYTPGILTFPSIGGYNLSNYQWGYYLCNKLSELDSPGEWFWDSSNSTLYLWPKNNVNPNNSNIEVALEQYGVRISSGRQYVHINNIDCKYYIDRAFIISGSNNKIENCKVIKSNKGLTVFGDNNLIKNTLFNNTYSTSIFITAGNNNIVEFCNFNECCNVPGLGESGWGYFGIRVSGLNNIIRNNNLSKIGYIGIGFDGNTLVEKNYIENACYTLSDGAAISFDNVDGAIVRDNIILYTLGNIESCAPNYSGCNPKGKGIYFGNTVLKNTIVERNTVAYCNGAGIWVDHTMVSTGNQIKNNTLFNNNLYQLGLSDYSNYNGPGATSPYAIAQYNDIYEGNICYSKSPSQKTMYHINRWFDGVDFGTFSNNRYFNPWSSTHIQIEKFVPSNTITNYILPQWQSIRGDDVGSTQSTLNLTYPNDTANHILIYNKENIQSVNNIPSGSWSDVNGLNYTGSVNLQPFESKILIKSISSPPQTIPTTPSTNASLILQASSVNTNSITLSWTSFASATGYTIHRKLKSSTSWGSSIASLSNNINQYTDNTAIPNIYYEYRVTRNSSVGTAYGYVSTGIALDHIIYRGHIILVIDNTFTSSLSNEINTLQNDLKYDGWSISRIDVSRTATPASIRTQIQNIYNSNSNTKAVLLLGHVPVYRSGNIAPDGHSSIPWSCDAYYGEMTSTWSTPPTTLPSDVELQVGRIDLYNMNAFSQSEEQLLRNYLNKLHNFKIKAITVQSRGLIQDNFASISNPMAETGYRTFGPLTTSFTVIPSYNSPNFSSRVSEGYLWTYSSGGGNYNTADGIGSTSTYASTPHNGIFNMTFGSYFGNWDANVAVPSWNNGQNNFLRAPLASGNALTNVWAGQPAWFFHHMGMGDNIGYSTLLSMNNRTSSSTYQPQNTGWLGQGYTTIHLGLMGDPTLRMDYISPPTNLSIINNGTSLTLTWNPSLETVNGYILYKINSSGVISQAYPDIISSTTLTASLNSTPGVEYIIRAVKLYSNNSGSYYNQSLGISAVVPQPTFVPINIKAFLQGPLVNNLMNDNLRANNFIPLTNNGYTTSQSVLNITGNSAIVDWVIVEIRNSSNPSNILFSRPALIQRDGDVVDTDGVSAVQLNISPGQYFVSIKHRNHLGVMTLNPIILPTTLIDFSTILTYGTNSQIQIGNVKALWSGDCNSDGIIRYTGTGNDRDLILSKIGGVVPTLIVSGYHNEDLNMDGVVKYTGQNNDRDLILSNIGGIIPTNTKISQLP